MIEIIQKQLLRTLCELEIVNLYLWHQETCLSPISIANAVQMLRNDGILQLSDNHENVSLTEYGRKWIELHANELFATKSEKPWKKVPVLVGMTGSGTTSPLPGDGSAAITANDDATVSQAEVLTHILQ